jgi:hypothetical protein
LSQKRTIIQFFDSIIDELAVVRKNLIDARDAYTKRHEREGVNHTIDLLAQEILERRINVGNDRDLYIHTEDKEQITALRHHRHALKHIQSTATSLTDQWLNDTHLSRTVYESLGSILDETFERRDLLSAQYPDGLTAKGQRAHAIFNGFVGLQASLGKDVLNNAPAKQLAEKALLVHGLEDRFAYHQ